MDKKKKAHGDGAGQDPEGQRCGSLHRYLDFKKDAKKKGGAGQDPEPQSSGSLHRDLDFKKAQNKANSESGFKKIGGSQFINWDFTKEVPLPTKFKTGRKCISLKTPKSMKKHQEANKGSAQTKPEPGRRCVSLKKNSSMDMNF
ncbi:hypothetical protein NL108_015031 [Boleophthalmus pectinirostris]|nr:hypothetical protein NL108_008199 [Boleophthalmus pectinirostris]KAJ0063238.1 hypothetical protein NL108_015031 [Boleophthalmus pectinirostris]